MGSERCITYQGEYWRHTTVIRTPAKNVIDNRPVEPLSFLRHRHIYIPVICTGHVVWYVGCLVSGVRPCRLLCVSLPGENVKPPLLHPFSIGSKTTTGDREKSTYCKQVSSGKRKRSHITSGNRVINWGHHYTYHIPEGPTPQLPYSRT